MGSRSLSSNLKMMISMLEISSIMVLAPVVFGSVTPVTVKIWRSAVCECKVIHKADSSCKAFKRNRTPLIENGVLLLAPNRPGQAKTRKFTSSSLPLETKSRSALQRRTNFLAVELKKCSDGKRWELCISEMRRSNKPGIADLKSNEDRENVSSSEGVPHPNILKTHQVIFKSRDPNRAVQFLHHRNDGYNLNIEISGIPERDW